jgi:hypothetical protein
MHFPIVSKNQIVFFFFFLCLFFLFSINISYQLCVKKVGGVGKKEVGDIED